MNTADMPEPDPSVMAFVRGCSTERLPEDLAARLEPHQEGQLYAKRHPDGWGVHLLIRPTATAAEETLFRAWADPILGRLLETSDPAIDGWYRCSEGFPWDWMMTCRTVVLPSLD
jgi:hypothetical protein